MTDEARGATRPSRRPASDPKKVRDEISRDPYGGWLGIELLELAPGYCRAAMRLAPRTC